MSASLSTTIVGTVLLSLSMAGIATASPFNLPPSAGLPNVQTGENSQMAAELSVTAAVSVKGKSLADLLEQLSDGSHVVLRVSDRSIRY